MNSQDRLAADVHLIAWPFRVVRNLIATVLFIIAVPVAFVIWLVYSLATGAPITNFDTPDSPAWVFSRLFIILYPFVFGAAFRFAWVRLRGRGSVVGGWGVSLLGMLLGFFIQVGTVWFWYHDYTFTTGVALLLLSAVALLPIIVALCAAEKTKPAHDWRWTWGDWKDEINERFFGKNQFNITAYGPEVEAASRAYWKHHAWCRACKNCDPCSTADALSAGMREANRRWEASHTPKPAQTDILGLGF